MDGACPLEAKVRARGTTEDDMSFAEFVERWTGRDLDYHEKAQTTGFIFAEACWNAALESAAAEAEDIAPGRDAEAIAEAILRMRSNARLTAPDTAQRTHDEQH